MSAVAQLREIRAAVRTLRPFARPHRRSFLQGSGYAIGLVACRLAFPWPLRGVMELVFHKGAHGRGAAVVGLVPHVGDPTAWLIGSFVAIVLLWGLTEARQRLAFARFAQGFARDARDAALLRLPEAAAAHTPGDVIARVTGDSTRLRSGVKGVLIGVSRNAGFFLGVSAIILAIDPKIGLVFVVGGVTTTVVTATAARRVSRVVRRSRERESRLVDTLHRTFVGAVDPIGRERPTTGTPTSKSMRIEVTATFLVHAMLAASTCAVLAMAIDAGRSGRLSPGSVFTILAYVLLMHNKTVVLGRQLVRLGRIAPSAERLAALVGPAQAFGSGPPQPVPAPDPGLG